MRGRFAIYFALVLTVGGHVFGQNPAPASPPMTLLASTGLPAGPAHKTLTQGAVCHMQINSIEQLANDLDELVMSAFPEEIAPPPLQELLKQPHPLLAFMGMQTVGAPLNAALLGSMTGIDITRPVTATFYVAPGGPSYVLSIPVADYRAFTGIMLNMTKAGSIEAATLQGRPCYRVAPTKPNLPKVLYVLCSPDRAYLCTSEMTATQLASAPPTARMNASSFVFSSVVDSAERDLLLCLDTGLLKQFLPMVEGSFMTIRPQQVAQIRQMIPAEMKPSINARIRAQTDFKSIDEVLDYTECFVLAAYEILAKDIIELVRGAEGMSLSLDISRTHQSMKVVVASNQIHPEKCTQPIPVKVITPLLARLPGSKDIITISGKQPKGKPSAFTKAWVPLVRKKMEVKALSSKTAESFLSYLLNIRPKQPMESLAPWTLTTLLQGEEIVIPEKAESIQQWFRSLTSVTPVRPVQATIMPVTEAALKAHFIRETKAAKQEWKNGQDFSALISQQQPFLEKDFGIHARALEGDVTQLILSTTYRTHAGYFGFDEHELVNRRFVNYRSNGSHLYIERGSRTPRWLNSPALGTPTKVRGAMGNLLAQAPADASAIQILTSENITTSLLDLADSAEATVHAELKNYLVAVRRAYANGAADVDTDALALAMPPYVTAVKQVAGNGKIYLSLPGDITYPRPLLAPAVRACFKEVTDKAGSLGGAASYARTLPGRHEVEVYQNSEGLALLIRSVGNEVFRRYIKTPDAQGALKHLLAGRYDAVNGEATTLFTNPASMFNAMGRP